MTTRDWARAGFVLAGIVPAFLTSTLPPKTARADGIVLAIAKAKPDAATAKLWSRCSELVDIRAGTTWIYLDGDGSGRTQSRVDRVLSIEGSTAKVERRIGGATSSEFNIVCSGDGVTIDDDPTYLLSGPTIPFSLKQGRSWKVVASLRNAEEAEPHLGLAPGGGYITALSHPETITETCTIAGTPFAQPNKKTFGPLKLTVIDVVTSGHDFKRELSVAPGIGVYLVDTTMNGSTVQSVLSGYSKDGVHFKGSSGEPGDPDQGATAQAETESPSPAAFSRVARVNGAGHAGGRDVEDLCQLLADRRADVEETVDAANDCPAWDDPDGDGGACRNAASGATARVESRYATRIQLATSRASKSLGRTFTQSVCCTALPDRFQQTTPGCTPVR